MTVLVVHAGPGRAVPLSEGMPAGHGRCAYCGSAVRMLKVIGLEETWVHNVSQRSECHIATEMTISRL